MTTYDDTIVSLKGFVSSARKGAKEQGGRPNEPFYLLADWQIVLLSSIQDHSIPVVSNYHLQEFKHKYNRKPASTVLHVFEMGTTRMFRKNGQVLVWSYTSFVCTKQKKFSYLHHYRGYLLIIMCNAIF